MKTNEELIALKKEVEAVNKKLAELTEDELAQVSGGTLQRALNQEASIGAVMNRLEFTSNNLTTSSENLQSAESTYRDADMAK